MARRLVVGFVAAAFAFSAATGLLEELATNSGSLIRKAVSAASLLASVGCLCLGVAARWATPHRPTPVPWGVRVLVWVFAAYGMLQVAVACRDLTFKTLTDLFATRSGAYVWIAPLALFVGGMPEVWQSLRRWAGWIAVLGSPLVALALVFSGAIGAQTEKSVVTSVCYLAMVSLLVARRLRAVEVVVFAGALGLYGVVALAATQRHMMLTALLFLVAYAYLAQWQEGHWVGKVLVVGRVALGLVAAAAVLLVVAGSGDRVVRAASDWGTAFARKLTVDNRSVLYAELFADFEGEDYLVGRGHLGTYASTSVLHHRAELERRTFEGGYATLVLKGGMIGLVLFLALSLSAAGSGLGRGADRLTKAAGCLVGIRLVEMMSSGMPLYDVSWLVFWLAAGACCSAAAAPSAALGRVARSGWGSRLAQEGGWTGAAGLRRAEPTGVGVGARRRRPGLRPFLTAAPGRSAGQDAPQVPA